MHKHTGGCYCGAIKFSTELDPMMVGQCNCNRCRRLFGTLAIGVFYAEDEITIEGDISSYGFEGGSGMPVTTHFCNKCGCSIFGKADFFPSMITMVLGAFDDPHAFKPKVEI